jgi:hypothetical protein
MSTPVPGWSTPELARFYPSFIAACALAKLSEHFTPDQLEVILNEFRDGRSHAGAEWPERQVKREAVRRVLVELYPDGIPDQAALPNKLLCQAVAARLSFLVSVDTILRAAGRKGSR